MTGKIICKRKPLLPDIDIIDLTNIDLTSVQVSNTDFTQAGDLESVMNRLIEEFEQDGV